MESKDDRKLALLQWLQNYCGLTEPSLEPIVGDASFRRYFRIHVNNTSYVAMDAPPPKESCFNFIAIAQALRAIGLKTPEIIFRDPLQGFLLISDFGSNTYLRILKTSNADALYDQALQSLLLLQSCATVPDIVLPKFTKAFMWQEWHWHKEWFANKLLELDLHALEKSLDNCFAMLATSAAEQPKVFMHRDYHSANLMSLPDAETGVLDFQDAFMGPITYDLVSLLRDCYIDWPDDKVSDWALHYYDLLQHNGRLSHVSEIMFIRWFDFMGINRHLKALFNFARKKSRDNNGHYLQYVPRTLNYIIRTSMKYPELDPIKIYIADWVYPAFTENYACVP